MMQDQPKYTQTWFRLTLKVGIRAILNLQRCIKISITKKNETIICNYYNINLL
jgi:hypothetical protein